MNYRIIEKPDKKEYAPYFQRYTDLVPDGNIIETLARQFSEAISFYKNLDSSKIDYQYAPGKWTIKEVIIHILDTERIFNYRALRFVRKDKTPLPGFEQDDYISKTDWEKYPFLSVLEEYELVRKYTLKFFNNMTDDMLQQSGISSDLNLAVRAIPFIIAGHEKHHLKIIKEKYM